MGILVLVGTVSAASISDLQPASTITYNEELVVNDTGRFDSIYIGKQDEGGVTFFNGTIVNSTTGDNDADNPVTFGDDVRIDGEIYRTEIGGDNPLKVSDTVIPTTNNTYSLGTSSNRFRDGYLSGTLTAGSITTAGALTAGSVVTSGTVDGVDVSAIPATYVSQSSPSWDSRTGYTTVPASSCIPEVNTITYTYPSGNMGYSFFPTAGAAIDFYCPIYLPHGATITSATAYVKDSGAGLITVGLYRSNPSIPMHYFLGTDSTNGLGSGDLEININSINEVVDNSQNTYNLNVFFSASGSDYNFHGAIINYTYTQPY